MYGLVTFTPSVSNKVKRRPFGWQQSTYNFLALGPKPPGDRALTWYDNATVTGVTKIADDKLEPLSAGARTALQNLAGDRTFPAVCTFQQAVIDLLMRPPVTWARPPLSAGSTGYRVWLGPGGPGQNLFYSAAAPQTDHSRLWADTFNRADGDLDGSTLSGGGTTWAEIGGTEWTVTSNRARFVDGAAATSVHVLTTTDADTDSLFAEADIVTVTIPGGGEVHTEVFVNSDAARGSGYYLVFGTAPGGSFRTLGAISTETDLATDTVASTTGLARIIRDGSSVEGRLNGATIFGPVTDTGEPSGVGVRRVGFTAYRDLASGAVVEVESFLGGDLSVSPAVAGDLRLFPKFLLRRR